MSFIANRKNALLRLLREYDLLDASNEPEGGGGGGTPAGSDGEIQFNDNGAFGASSEASLSLGDGGNVVLNLGATANGTAEIHGNAPGVQLQIVAADGDVAPHQTGGEVGIQSGGGGIGGNGGDIQVVSGGGGNGGDSGGITIATGAGGIDGNSGPLDLRTGQSADGNSGDINIITGGAIANQGNVLIQGKAVGLYGGDGVRSAEINANGFFIDNLTLAGSVVGLAPVAFAGLPTPAEGMLAWVNDSNTVVWGATIAGGGANKVLAVFNGTNWTVAGK